MLSTKEKRFIKYWEEQRTGGRWSYFALYIPVGTFLCAILTTFLFSMFSMIEVNFFVVVAVVSALLATMISIGAWYNNERKFKKLIHREVTRGKLRDEQAGSDNGTDENNA